MTTWHLRAVTVICYDVCCRTVYMSALMTRQLEPTMRMTWTSVVNDNTDNTELWLGVRHSDDIEAKSSLIQLLYIMQSAILVTSSLQQWMPSHIVPSTLHDLLFGVTAYCSSYNVWYAVTVHMAHWFTPQYDIAFANACAAAAYWTKELSNSFILYELYVGSRTSSDKCNSVTSCFSHQF